MRFVRDLVSILALLASTTVFAADPGEVPAPAGVVLGYYLASAKKSVEEIHYGSYTHLVASFIRPQPDGTPRWPDFDERRFIDQAHRAGVKVLIAIGGENSGPAFARVAGDSSLREQFLNAVADGVVRKGYDGCDVDWEFPAPGESNAFAEFVQILASKLKTRNPQAMLTLAIPALDNYGRNYPLESLIAQLDFVQVMTYEFHGPWKRGDKYSHSGYNAALFRAKNDPRDGHRKSCADALHYWSNVRRIPKEKLVIGIPCFGHGFGTNEWAVEPVAPSRYATFHYRELSRILATPDWESHWDEEAGVPWSRNTMEQEIITYDDPKSAAAKATWARQSGVRGIFFWEISQDRVAGKNMIVDSAEAAFRGSGVAFDVTK